MKNTNKFESHSDSSRNSSTRHSCAGRNLESCHSYVGRKPESCHSCAGRNLIFSILFLLISIFLTGCSDFVSSDRFTQSHYTLNAILKAGETIGLENPVWVGKSSSLSNLNSAELFVTDATVTITQISPANDTLSFTLVPVIFPMPDSDRTIVFYADPVAHIIQPDFTYRVEVTIPGYNKTIRAETKVPKTAVVFPNFNYNPPAGEGYSFNPADSTFIHYPEVDLHYPVTVRVDGAQSVNYMVELYCLEEFSTDLEFTTVFLGQEHPTEELRSNYYQASGETIRRINIMSRFYSKQHTDGNWYVSLTDYRQAFVFYGRYRVTAYVMDDNYYKYTYMPEGYFYGGVQNGLGCFGSVSGGVMYTKIVK